MVRSNESSNESESESESSAFESVTVLHRDDPMLQAHVDAGWIPFAQSDDCRVISLYQPKPTGFVLCAMVAFTVSSHFHLYGHALAIAVTAILTLVTRRPDTLNANFLFRVVGLYVLSSWLHATLAIVAPVPEAQVQDEPTIDLPIRR